LAGAGGTAAFAGATGGWPAATGVVLVVALLMATLVWILADLARTIRLIGLISAWHDRNGVLGETQPAVMPHRCAIDTIDGADDVRKRDTHRE